MPSRKDVTLSMEDAPGGANAAILQRIRQMWQFANLCQWIYIFGKAAKIDESLEIDEIEHECMKPTSTVLSDIGLALLKLVSSHRGLTPDIFDEQLRKQYLAKAPEVNPLGDGEEQSQTFGDLDVVTKIKVLQQLTQWVMIYPERLREKMDEQKDTDQTSWRIEPYGWDAQDRTYFVLDDNRVYRFSEPPAVVVSKAKPKPKKTFGSSRRSSKRRRAVSDVVGERLTNDDNDDENNTHGSDSGGVQWECVAVTLEDVRLLINSMRKTRDGNEKVLRDQLEVHLLPILERQDESRKRKQEKHEREMLNLAKMASAKRSSRIAHKIEQQKQDEKDREENERLLLEGEEERRAEQKRLKLERQRDFRMFSREKRLKERDYRRQLHQKELNQLSEDNKFGPDGTARVSERRVQLEIERNKQVLKELEDEDEDWTFDCICGLYGQVDDGAHSIACERCNVWQHSKCVNVDEAEADRPDFQFFCTTCRRRIEEENTPRKTIKLKIKGPSEVAATKQRVAQLSNAPTDQSLSPISPNDAAKHESQRAPTQGAEIASPLSSHAATGPFTGKQESSQAGMLARSHEEMAPEGGDPSQLRADIPAAVPTMRAASFSKESDLGHGSIRSATVLKSDIFNAAEKQQDGHTVNVATTPLHSKAGVDMPEPSGAGTTQPSRTTTPQSSSHQPQDSISGTNHSSATLQPRSAPFGFRQLPPLQPRSACQSDKTPTDLPSQPVTTVTLPPISSFSNPSMDRPVAHLEPREQYGERTLHSGDGSQQQ